MNTGNPEASSLFLCPVQIDEKSKVSATLNHGAKGAKMPEKPEFRINEL
ncbi:hypothetical protein [Holdemania sp. Marseille-P2844]|nr:hypothetical protein [Holdemania sp. Marseille-P2844]